MQSRSRILDDLARLAGGAAGTLHGVREEIEALVRQRVERLISDFDLVTREEFEAARDMAAKARAEQERLENRIVDLEKRIKTKAGAKAAKPAKSGARKKPSASKPRARTK
jgi:BMFP domain-containing protein YqiC